MREKIKECVYFVTNKRLTYGAPTILLKETTSKMLEIYPDGYFMIPNSVHEWAAFSPKVLSPESALRLLQKLIRPKRMSPSEWLGDKVFKVDKTGRII